MAPTTQRRRDAGAPRGRAKIARWSGARLGPLAALALALGLGGGLATSCATLDRGLSCGDGWFDASVEDCDPMDPDGSHLSACRDMGMGFEADATCDPETCEVRATVADCNVCGDGVRAQGEECDGEDIPPGEGCVGGGQVRCDENCEIDRGGCVDECKGNPLAYNECDPNESCATDGDCDEGQVCAVSINECLEAVDGFSPNLSCSGFQPSGMPQGVPGEPAVMQKTQYSSGTISGCTDQCLFGRDDCSFCGDGVLDREYTDIGINDASLQITAETCDGEFANPEALAVHCRPLCTDGPIDPNLPVYCDFQCKDDCSGFGLPDDVSMGTDPIDLGCCLAPGTVCPLDDENDVVPDLPCCYWKDHPDLDEDSKCVYSATPPLSKICPGG